MKTIHIICQGSGKPLSSCILFDFFFLRWNQLDLAIVLLSVMGITLEEIEINAALPINPTIIRIMRVLRIARGERGTGRRQGWRWPWGGTQSSDSLSSGCRGTHSCCPQPWKQRVERSNCDTHCLEKEESWPECVWVKQKPDRHGWQK